MKPLCMVLAGVAIFLLGAAVTIGVIVWMCWQKIKHNDVGRSD